MDANPLGFESDVAGHPPLELASISVTIAFGMHDATIV